MTTALLDEVEAFIARFVAFPSPDARVAVSLWTAHSHLLHCFETTPRLAFLSPEPASGKTRALDILELLCPRPLHAVNCTPAALFRSVGNADGTPPTVLYDEIDTVFGPKAKDNEDIRGMLNAGYKRGAKALRCVIKGKTVEVEEIDAFAAVALAGLGDLPDTIMTRAVVVRMRRRAPHERLEPYRYRANGAEGEALRDQLTAWASVVATKVDGAWPALPPGVEDRDAEVWEPLLAVADAAGGTWPERARVAAVALVALARDKEGSLGVRLLADLRDVFADDERLPTATIIERLCQLEESPWSDLRGRPIDARGIANRLRGYGVTSKVIRVGDSTPHGYVAVDLHDAWARYLPMSSGKSATAATAATLEVGAARSTCEICGEAMTRLDPWQMSHPGCDQPLRLVEAGRA